MAKTVKLRKLNMGSNSINIADLAAGVYFINVVTPESKTSEKLIIE